MCDIIFILSISIHALREEGDCRPRLSRKFHAISIHALREEGDFSGRRPEMSRFRFLSTPSARRATPGRAGCQIPAPYFYPRPPRGGRQSGRGYRKLRLCISIHALREEGDRPTSGPRMAGADISIHALREEGDRRFFTVTTSFRIFLSTPSARRATSGRGKPQQRAFHFYPRPPRGGRQEVFVLGEVTVSISIHALREEGDL